MSSDDDKNDVYETKGDGKVESQGLDLNAYCLTHILPGAAAMCEEGRQREIAQERDKQPVFRSVYWMVEVRHGVWETTSQLPHGMPPLVVRGKPERANWEYVAHLERYRIARGHAARKIARESTFMVAGRGVQT